MGRVQERGSGCSWLLVQVLMGDSLALETV